MAPDYTRTSTADYHGCTSTTSTSTSDYNWTDTNSYTSTYGYYKELEREEEERLLRLEEKEELMEGWFPRKPEIKSIRRRPSVRLRGVRLDGRGWA